MIGKFLDSADPFVRRLSAAAYATATGAGAVAWTASGGLDALRDGKVLLAIADAVVGLPIWWIVAGVGLRLVRRIESRRRERSSVDAQRPIRGTAR